MFNLHGIKIDDSKLLIAVTSCSNYKINDEARINDSLLIGFAISLDNKWTTRTGNTDIF
jgi:hypothetical protein